MIGWLLCTVGLREGQVYGQFRIRAKIGSSSEKEDQDYLLIPTPPRALRRLLESAEESIEREEYSDAIEAIEELLEGQDSEDYFLPPDERGRRTSLKRRALELLDEMPAAGREIYELNVGAQARRQLEQAISAGDVAGVREVSRRFFHTPTGYRATMLLARCELDRGRPLAAILYLQRLAQSESAAKTYGHELPLLQAACWQIADNPTQADRVISENLPQLAGATIALGGVPQQLPAVADEIAQWLRSTIGSRKTFQSRSGANWLLARGNARRNSTVNGGFALSKLEWDLATDASTSPTDLRIIRSIRDSLYDSGTPALPSLQPLAIGDQLVFRTANETFGAMLSTGTLSWTVASVEPTDDADSAPPENRQSANPQVLRAFLTQRMCMDSTYGQMSSDGKRLFRITSDRPMPVPRSRSNPFAVPRQTMTNDLVAVEVKSQGKLLWTTMETWDDQPFFLGPPLPIENELYAIAEIKEEIKLVCLDPATGKLRWSQKLAQIDGPFASNLDPVRRLAGATPSFANGIMVCPTSSDAIVAVDIAARTLLWVHTYESAGMQNVHDMFGNQSANYMQVRPGNAWADTFAVIDQGFVVIPLAGVDQLACLDLLTGQLRWSLPRKNMLYVGGIDSNTVVMIEKNHVSGLDVATGKEIWDTIALPNGAFTSGRGFLSDGHYYLPIGNGDSPATGALVQINLRDGTHQSHPTERVLGNLICHGDYLVSQGLDGVFAYALRDRKRAAILAAMESGDLNPELLEDYANILAGDGERAKAIEVMKQAHELETDPVERAERNVSLLRLMIESLHRDFQTHQNLVEQATRLATTPELQNQLDHVVALGLMNVGDFDAALSAHLRLIENSRLITDAKGHVPIEDSANQLTPVNQNNQWRACNAVNLAHRIQSILEKSNDPQAAQKTISDAIQNVRQSQDIARMESWVKVISNLPQFALPCDQLRLDIAGALQEKGSALPGHLCELLRPATMNPEDAIARDASVLLTQVYATSAPRLTVKSLEKIATRWPELAFALDDRTPQTASAWLDELQTIPSEDLNAWPSSRVTVARSEPRTTTAHPYGQTLEIQLNSQTEEWPLGGSVYVNLQPAEILVTDGSGATIRRCRLRNFNPVSARFASARHYGNVLVINLGDQLIGIDMLSDLPEPLWEFQINRRELGQSPSFSFKQITLNFVEQERIALDPHGYPYGEIGAIGDFGVCIMKGTELNCLDIHTGLPRWTVRDIGGKVRVFGDGEHCFVTRSLSGETAVHEMRMGEKVQTVRIPRDNHWATFGRFLLHYEGMYTTGRNLQVRVYDCLKEQTVWSQNVARFTRADVIQNQELALLEPDEDQTKPSRLTIRNITDGAVLLEKQLKPEKKELESLSVWRSRGQYLVVTNHSDLTRTSTQQRKGIRTWAPNSRLTATRLTTGHAYGIDRETGEFMWPAAAIEQYGIPRTQPLESPLFVTIRQVLKGRSSAKITTDVGFLDRRTGKITTATDSDKIRSTTCKVIADKDTQQVIVQLANARDFIATFADPTAPPENPRPAENDPDIPRQTTLQFRSNSSLSPVDIPEEKADQKDASTRPETPKGQQATLEAAKQRRAVIEAARKAAERARQHRQNSEAP